MKRSPNFALPYAALAWLYVLKISLGLLAGENGENLRAQAGALIEMAIERDPNDAWAHIIRGRLEIVKGNYELARTSADRALSLNPNSALGYRYRASVNAHGGFPEAAIADFELAERLSPKDPENWLKYTPGAWALLQLGRYEEVVSFSMEAERLNRHVIWAPAHKAAALVALGQRDAAREALQEMVRRNPSVNARFLKDNMRYQANQEFVDWFIDQLREVGLSDE